LFHNTTQADVSQSEVSISKFTCCQSKGPWWVLEVQKHV